MARDADQVVTVPGSKAILRMQVGVFIAVIGCTFIASGIWFQLSALTKNVEHLLAQNSDHDRRLVRLEARDERLRSTRTNTQ